MATNCIHNEVPGESIAQFSSNGQRAVIETTDGKVFSFSMSRSKGTRFEEERAGFHASKWLQGAGGSIKMQPSGEFPFPELELHLELLSRVDSAVRYFEVSLDPDFEIETRKKYAEGAATLLGDVEVFAAVVPTFMAKPMPPEWDATHGPTEGMAGELLKAMVAKWR